MRALEWIIDRFGNWAVRLARSGSWWRRALALVLTAWALWLLALLTLCWFVFGKKPENNKETPHED